MLEKLKQKYQNLNKLSLEDRLIANSPVEMWILETINHHGFDYNGSLIKNWRKCRSFDDRRNKRDAEALVDGKFLYAQIKFRQPDSGNDIGCAILQPYPGLIELKRDIRSFLARDVLFDGCLYACLNNSWDKLILLPFKEEIKPIYRDVLREWLSTGTELDEDNRTFWSKKWPGAQLKWKKDSGKNSFDSGIVKIICYLPLDLFDEKYKFDMIDVPGYIELAQT